MSILNTIWSSFTVGNLNIKYVILFLSIIIFICFIIIISIILFIVVSYITYKLFKINMDTTNILFYQYNKQSQYILDTYGEHKLTRIYLMREPFSQYFKLLLNISTAFNYETIIKHLNFYPYHISLVFEIKLNNGHKKFILVEKNNSINISDTININKHQELKQIYLCKNTKNITLNSILEKTKQRIGINYFYNWKIYNNNCKKFVIDILKTINKYTKTNQQFIYGSNKYENKVINIIAPTDFSLHIINSCVNIYNIFENCIKM
jgi:hypothetical protein